jgi:hypothetical protein
MKKENVDKMSLQEAMDFSINKIVEQGGRCMIDNNCAYGNNKGQHCAVGWLLDEDNVALMRAGGGVSSLVLNHAPALPQLILENEKQFRCLANFHDSPIGDRMNSLSYSELKAGGIDVTTNPNWDKWLDMGK